MQIAFYLKKRQPPAERYKQGCEIKKKACIEAFFPDDKGGKECKKNS